MPNSQIVVGNWKMNGTVESAVKLAKEVVKGAAGVPATVVLCPSALHVPYLTDVTKGNAVVVGGQDCHFEEKGAFTGDISPLMLKNVACEYVIVGHSERRHGAGETNHMVKKKAESALKAELKPIICIGETAEERGAGEAKNIVEKQLLESIPEGSDGYHVVIAYEPVWAIGTGDVATAEDIEEMHNYILNVLVENFDGFNERTNVLYGGSVNASNAKEILNINGVGGVLVGGASLKAEEFLTIIREAK